MGMSERYPHQWEFRGKDRKLGKKVTLILECPCGKTSPNPLPERLLADCPWAIRLEGERAAAMHPLNSSRPGGDPIA